MIRVVIFDFDGLLVDSQPLQFESYRHVLSKHGIQLSQAEWVEFIHKSYSIQQWFKIKDISLDPEKIRSEKMIMYNRLITDKLLLKPGAGKLVELLSGKYKLGVASASRIESINLGLRKFGLEARFEIVLSDIDCAHGKPFPDVLLKIADSTGEDPKDCLVLEDSVAGLKAAKAAGMKCIVCPDTFQPVSLLEFEGADKIVGSLDEITLQTIEQV